MKPGKWQGPFGHPDTSALISNSRSGLFSGRIAEKRWCYVGIVHPDIVFGCAVIHLGYLNSAFMFAFDRKTRQKVEKNFIFPPVGQVRFDRNPETGRYCYRSLSGCIDIHNRAQSQEMKVLSWARLKNGSFKADFNISWENGAEPVHFLMPMQKSNTAFTTKAAGLPVEGCIRFNDTTHEIRPDTAFAVFDWTNGFYPRHTFWNWACGAGRDEAGNIIGFNFSRGVYEYGQLENTVWVNGRPYFTGPVEFEYDKAVSTACWKIKNPENQIELTFEPEGARSADDNLVIIKSRFIQAIGAFNGRISIDGTTRHLKSVAGVTEEHFAKW